MTLNERWRGPSVRLLAELFVVFLGVFVALAADSWWEGRASEARRAAYVRSLESDLEVARTGLQEDLVTTEQWIDEIERFGAWLERPQSSDVPLPSLSLVTPAVPTGTMRALLSTGDINLFEDAEFRSAIIRAESTIASSLEERRLYVMTSSETAWDGAVAVQALRTSGRRQPAPSMPTVLDIPAETVRADPVLSAVFTHHRLTLLNDLAILEEMLDVVTGLLAAIESAEGAL